MASRLCMEAVLAACFALGVTVWGIQSTAPAVLLSEDAAPSRIASSIQFPLPTIIEPARAESIVAGHNDSAGKLGPDSFFVARSAEGDARKQPPYHHVVVGRAIPGVPILVSNSATEVVSSLPSADGI